MNRQQLEYAVLIVFVFLFLWFAVQAVLIDDTTRFYVVLISIVLLGVPVLFERKMAVILPFGTKSIVALALFLHIAGGINRWYWKFMPYYDKLAHGVSALALGLLIFSFFLVLDSWEIRVRPSRILPWIFVLVLLLGLCWEVGEYYIDVLVQSSYNNGVTDSILDVLSNTIGTIVAMAIAARYLKSVPAGRTPGYLLNPEQ
ncbi:MAG: hypothetical protein GKC05_07295 [Methanomicrobiales archaeon]|nr:hypothetical protein [Methanomicrobiales archaeon]NYT20705.1 hypothetical protein [Methanomicrobiales archaeon]